MRSNTIQIGGWLAAIALAAIALAACACAADEYDFTAGRWFLGAEGGFVSDQFETTYEYMNNGTPDKYTEKVNGGEIALAFGYAMPVHGSLAMDFMGRIAGNNAEWTLDTVDEYSGTDQGGPARLSFEIPFFYDLLLRPRLSLPANFSIFGEFGLRYGHLRCKKYSASSTQYNITSWVPGLVVGGGVQFDAMKNLSLYVNYRYASLDEGKTESVFPDDTAWERVAVKAQVQSIGIGAVFVY